MLGRQYRTLSPNVGAFGRGANHSYGYSLDSAKPATAQAINFITPDWDFFLFSRQPDGTLLNTTNPVFMGAVMRTRPDGSAQIRWKNGVLFEFQAPGVLVPQLASIIDRNGNVTSLTRDGVRLTRITDPTGRSIQLTYDNSNRIISATDPIGRTVQYAYNALGSLASATDPMGGVTRYEYEAADRLSTIIDPRNVVVVENTYDGNGRVVQQKYADGGIQRMEYTPLNPTVARSPVIQTTVTDPMGKRAIYRFDPAGNLLSTTDALGQGRTYHRRAGSNMIEAVTGSGSCATCGSAPGDVSYTLDGIGNVLSRMPSTEQIRPRST